MSWIYQGNVIIELPDDCVGFVYLITNTVSGRMYVGKKLAKFSKVKYKTIKQKNGNPPPRWGAPGEDQVEKFDKRGSAKVCQVRLHGYERQKNEEILQVIHPCSAYRARSLWLLFEGKVS